jgi:hypothetical protein
MAIEKPQGPRIWRVTKVKDGDTLSLILKAHGRNRVCDREVQGREPSAPRKT